MAERKTEKQLDLIFQALADSTRRSILRMVAEKECTVSEMAEPFKMSLAAVSKHIKVLEKAGLIQRAIDGRIHRCKMDARPLVQASTLIAHYQKFWESGFDQLEKFLKETNQQK
jgi:DNA-binding transcriptional ArsR family regulator